MKLSSKQRDQFISKLQDRKKELLEVKAFGEQSAATVELDQSRVGRLSRMDAVQSQAMFQETNRRRDIELLKIDSALERIEMKRFGDCLACDEEIALNRLVLDLSIT